MKGLVTYLLVATLAVSVLCKTTNAQNNATARALKSNSQLNKSQLPGISTEPGATLTTVKIQVDLDAYPSIIRSHVDFSPELGTETRFSVSLFDDGKHNDRFAGDGIWGNQLQIENRKFPFNGDVVIQTAFDTERLQDHFTAVRFRPAPVLAARKVAWENGLQDGELNRNEQINLQLTFRNADALNHISTLHVINLTRPFFLQRSITDQWILPSEITTDLPLFLTLVGPSDSDHMAIEYRLDFDGHQVEMSADLTVKPWISHPVWGDTLRTARLSERPFQAFPIVADPNVLTGHNYQITFFSDNESNQLRWRLRDVETGEIKIDHGIFNNSPFFPHPIVDGIQFQIQNPLPGFLGFEVVANAAGRQEPPLGAAFDFAGFPSRLPDQLQQSSGEGKWGIHVVDNGKSNQYGNPENPSGDNFLGRITRDGKNLTEIVPYDFEMRFTGTSIAWSAVNPSLYMEVPFELWNTGINTPDDTSDDFRMLPVVFDSDGSQTFNLSGRDHTVSDGLNDPFSDWIFWFNPTGSAWEEKPGELGYKLVADSIKSGFFTGNNIVEVMARMVLVNWDGGNAPPYNQELPEEGTVFRIKSTKPFTVGDTLLVAAPARPAGLIDGSFVGEYELFQNYPNPFNNETIIPFNIEREARVTLEIFNILGQQVSETVVERMEIGSHTFRWDGRDINGRDVSSGIYFYRVTLTPFSELSQQFSDLRKMILVR